MKNQKKLLGLITVISLSGCSSLKSQFLGTSLTPATSTKPLQYNFPQPRRGALDSATVTKLNNSDSGNNAYMYYSANGHECRNISSEFNRTACRVNEKWKESAPVLVVRIP